MLRQLAFVAALAVTAAAQTTATSDAPTYTTDGKLNVPANYREWIYLTSGIDMTYTQPTSATNAPPAHSIFDNVFVNPTAYRSFLQTGTWPDKTTMILEVRTAENPVSINKTGHTQSANVLRTEVHVKDKNEWSFYVGGKPGGNPASLVPKTASCYTCHQAHGAVDTTFTQFYPTLLPIATDKKTLSKEYLAEQAEPAK
ncbi:cytochrome P460 family protein [Terriglobus tenax]|uniref:cytochrome P460 family protein n=1 Tax=Terriglobus tenax TaxID=1111115 RepID=UPI0021DFE7AD|nr:cytochrome P460 family protein [Terriglobus tenax]